MRIQGLILACAVTTTACKIHPLRNALLLDDPITVGHILKTYAQVPPLITLFKFYNYHPKFKLFPMMMQFLMHNADIYAKSPNSCTLLHYAAAHNESVVINTLMRRYPISYRDQIINAQDLYGKTPLHYAIAHKQTDAIRTLLRHGASLTLCDNEGISPKMAGQASTNRAVQILFQLSTIYQQNQRIIK